MRFVETVMGIPMSIDIRAADADAGASADAAAAAFAMMADADRRFSVYRDDSEVSLVNRGLIGESAFSDELREVLEIGEAFRVASGGAFRVRASDGRLDTDGVVKGWAASRAAGVLLSCGVSDFCLNAGGDVVVGGSPGDGAAWNVGIRSPSDPARMLAVLSVTDCAVATSGAYERGRHIVDGRTGLPATGLTSATVVADDLTTADVLATSVFALGPDGVGWAMAQGATGVLALTDAGAPLAAGTLPFARPRRD
ncbi:FAD:protein FMN transferase [Diaminobutyricibacter sp. McL0608]|uniref:FAD:protein FMN transferase n=1 Tax=Leifsonia sp. McL0608 TaxID=3143537 RepID=UPI0031F2F37D